MSADLVDRLLEPTLPTSPARSGGLVSVVIVNWNAGTMLGRCLKSIDSGGDDPCEAIQVIVVDNASTDGSVEAAVIGRSVEVIWNKKNVGFAAASNQGAAVAKGEFILFLNPDCRVNQGAIAACRRVLQTDPGIGVVGVALTDEYGHVSRSCHRFPGLSDFFFRLSGLSSLSGRFRDGSMRDWPHDEDREVDHVMGAFYMVRSHDFRLLGGFDERFFVYLEDLDLSLRYRTLGKRSLYLSSVSAYHYGGGSSEQVKAERLLYATRSRVLYAFKHFSALAAWIHLFATLLVEPLARVVGALVQRRAETLVHIVRAFGMFYKDLPHVLRGARTR